MRSPITASSATGVHAPKAAEIVAAGYFLMRRHHFGAYPGGLGLSTQRSNPSSEPATQS
jgi:hypothetical protein